MNQDLINQRESTMDRADRALDAAWPSRIGSEYVHEMQAVAEELKGIAAAMAQEKVDPAEQSRVYRYLGSIYSDMAPALGHDNLFESQKFYEKAEHLLEGNDDLLEQAKLNFNFANTLRQVDPDNIELLEESKRRFMFAKDILQIKAPEFMPRIHEALLSVTTLLKIAPLINNVNQLSREMEGLQRELQDGGGLADIAKRTNELINRDGGVPGLILKAQALLNELPAEIRQSEKHNDAVRMIDDLKKRVLIGGSIGDQDTSIIYRLRERLEAEVNEGKVDEERAKTLRELIEKMEMLLG